MLWEITGANSQTGAPVFFYLDAPGEGEAREAVGDIGVLAERVSRADVSLPSPSSSQGVIEVELSRKTIARLRTRTRTIAGGIFFGLLFWTLFCVLMFLSFWFVVGVGVAAAAGA